MRNEVKIKPCWFGAVRAGALPHVGSRDDERCEHGTDRMLMSNWGCTAYRTGNGPAVWGIWFYDAWWELSAGVTERGGMRRYKEKSGHTKTYLPSQRKGWLNCLVTQQITVISGWKDTGSGHVESNGLIYLLTSKHSYLSWGFTFPNAVREEHFKTKHFHYFVSKTSKFIDSVKLID